jgi:hypothetical protein
VEEVHGVSRSIHQLRRAIFDQEQHGVGATGWYAARQHGLTIQQPTELVIH